MVIASLFANTTMFSSKSAAGRIAGVLFVTLLAALPGRASAQILSPDPQRRGCDWTEPNSNTAYPETNARYFRLPIPRARARGLRLRIEGDYLASRYFSYQLYGALFNALDVIADHQIEPDAGSQSPFVGPTRIDPGVKAGGRYTVFVVFSDKPSRPAPNTLYAGTNALPRLRNYLFLRAYLPDGPIPLPTFRYEDENGRPAADGLIDTAACADTANDGSRRSSAPGTVAAGNAGTEGSASAVLARDSRDVPFEVYRGLGPAGSGVVYNQDAGFMSARIEDRDTLVLVRFRAPSYPRLRGPVVADVRYWSLCQNRQALQTVIACVADRDAAVDRSGFFHAVVGDLAGRPVGATARRGFSYLPNAGLLDNGFLIYRQLLARTDFPGAIRRVPEGSAPEAVLGDYAPQATTCPRRVFSARSAAGDSAAQVFAACRAAR